MHPLDAHPHTADARDDEPSLPGPSDPRRHWMAVALVASAAVLAAVVILTSTDLDDGLASPAPTPRTHATTTPVTLWPGANTLG